jgi:hypothetical protein
MGLFLLYSTIHATTRPSLLLELRLLPIQVLRVPGHYSNLVQGQACVLPPCLPSRSGGPHGLALG